MKDPAYLLSNEQIFTLDKKTALRRGYIKQNTKPQIWINQKYLIDGKFLCTDYNSFSENEIDDNFLIGIYSKFRRKTITIEIFEDFKQIDIPDCYLFCSKYPPYGVKCNQIIYNIKFKVSNTKLNIYLCKNENI